MKRLVMCLALLFLTLSALGQDYLPHDVQRFIVRREACDLQLRGYRDRENELSRELHKVCGGIDKELVQLKRKYVANSTIMQILYQFEPSIEVVKASARNK